MSNENNLNFKSAKITSHNQSRGFVRSTKSSNNLSSPRFQTAFHHCRCKSSIRQETSSSFANTFSLPRNTSNPLEISRKSKKLGRPSFQVPSNSQDFRFDTRLNPVCGELPVAPIAARQLNYHGLSN